MIASMTAFARSEVQTPSGSLIWEIRSINHRFLDISFRLPDSLKAQESLLRDQVRRQLQRGKVECQLRLQSDNLENLNLAIDTSQVKALHQAFQQLKILMPEANAANLMDLLKWPGVVKTAEINSEAQQQQVSELLKQALQGLLAARQREGNQLCQFIVERVTAIEQQINAIKPTLANIIQHQREQILGQLKQAQVVADSNRLEQELVFMAQRIDVSEELSRLETHLQEVQRVLQQGGAVGRRLDFLMQELHREANTLGSKSVHILTSQAAIEMKILIEQMREQIQNIE